MSVTSFNDLPFELQCQIILNLYSKWWLNVEEVKAFTANPVYKIVSCKTLASGPLLACQSMYRATQAVLESQFTGLLDATSCLHVTSIIPKFKAFLPKVTMVVMDHSQGALQMSYIYAQKLAGLRTIQLKSCVIWPVSEHKLAEALDSEVADADLIEAIYTPMLNVNSAIAVAKALVDVQFLYEQVFKFDTPDRLVSAPVRSLPD